MLTWNTFCFCFAGPFFLNYLLLLSSSMCTRYVGGREQVSAFVIPVLFSWRNQHLNIRIQHMLSLSKREENLELFLVNENQELLRTRTSGLYLSLPLHYFLTVRFFPSHKWLHSDLSSHVKNRGSNSMTLHLFSNFFYCHFSCSS